MKLRVQVLVATGFALMVPAVPATAEIVFLQSGGTLSVKGHRYDGDSIVLSLRKGGEVTCDRSLIDKIVPDEVPDVEPAPAQGTTSGETPQPPRLLEAATPFGEIIAAVSQAHGVDPLLVSALIKVESGYRPKARSRKGAMGLMQLMPSTAREYKVRNPFDPRANIEGGIKHLKSLIDRFDGGLDLALAAYNAGEGAVKRFNGIPPYRETRNYVSRILSIAGLK
jgi:hypothetical protein